MSKRSAADLFFHRTHKNRHKIRIKTVSIFKIEKKEKAVIVFLSNFRYGATGLEFR